MKYECAPILISVYNRKEHLERCINSIQLNQLSRVSDLFIISDGAYSPDHESAISFVRSYADQIKGFHDVTVIKREQNLGSFLSAKSAIDEVIDHYGKVIFLEDDNLVAPNFLAFLNEGLRFYESDPSVFSVCAYNYPIRMPSSYPHDVYKWQGFSAWGVGLWKAKWSAVDWDFTGFAELAKNRKRKKELDAIAEHLYQYISYDIQHKRMIIDTIISYHLFLKKRYSIFPVLSKVRNVGHDGTGEHGGLTDRYRMQPIDSGGDFSFVRGIKADKDVNRLLRRHFKIPIVVKVKSRLGAHVPERVKKWVKGFLGKQRADTSRSHRLGD